jgi:hypothetical protein
MVELKKGVYGGLLIGSRDLSLVVSFGPSGLGASVFAEVLVHYGERISVLMVSAHRHQEQLSSTEDWALRSRVRRSSL